MLIRSYAKQRRCNICTQPLTRLLMMKIVEKQSNLTLKTTITEEFVRGKTHHFKRLTTKHPI